MKRAFVITLDVPDDEDPDTLIPAITDALESDLFLVVSVNPWSSHGEATSTASQTFPVL